MRDDFISPRSELNSTVTSQVSKHGGKVPPMKTSDPTYQTNGAHGAIYANRFLSKHACFRTYTHTNNAKTPHRKRYKRLNWHFQAVSIVFNCCPFSFLSKHKIISSRKKFVSRVDIPWSFVSVMATSLEGEKVALTELSCWESCCFSFHFSFCSDWDAF